MYSIVVTLKTTCTFSGYHQVMSSNSAYCEVCVLDTASCDKVSAGQWFSSGNPVSFNNKTDHHDISKALLTLSTITQSLYLYEYLTNDSGFLDFSTFIYLYIEKDVCHIEKTHIHTVISETPHGGMQIRSRFSTAENNPIKNEVGLLCKRKSITFSLGRVCVPSVGESHAS